MHIYYLTGLYPYALPVNGPLVLTFDPLNSGMSIVLMVAEGDVFVNDAEIQKSALQVVINCVCAPDKRISSIGKFIAGSARRRLPQQTKSSESVLSKMWNVVQSNNGIKVLEPSMDSRHPPVQQAVSLWSALISPASLCVVFGW